jgi:hypothetical protein
MSNITKFSRIANILLIIFPIFFAINVCSSIQTEDIKVFDKVKENEEGYCFGSIFLNLSFAVLLAALWNGKKIIKVGVL